MDIYQSVIASSRYARFIPELKRRETWEETVDRMVNYLKSKNKGLDKEFKEIREAIVVGQSWDNDIRIILFIIMNKNFTINDNLLDKIKKQIRKNASPRHVPSKIIVVKDIPRTKNGKIAELAVKNIIEGNKIKNREALANPNILEEYKNLKELKY